MSMIGMEPYSGRLRGGLVTSQLNAGRGRGGAAKGTRVGARAGGGVVSGSKPPTPYAQMTPQEKADLCCRDWNSARGEFRGFAVMMMVIMIMNYQDQDECLTFETPGCSKATCSRMHKCSRVDVALRRVCWRPDHTNLTHP